jgi:hypothetical protein
MKKQGGFSLVEGLLIVVFVSAVTSAGILAYSRSNSSTPEINLESTNQGGEIAILNKQDPEEKSLYQQCVDDGNEVSISDSIFICTTDSTIYGEDGTQIDISITEKSSSNIVELETWKDYIGDGFSFSYPERWDNLAELPESWKPALIETANDYTIGGGFGPVIKFDSTDDKWVIEELGRFPGDRKVGDDFNLYSRISTSGVVVYEYTDGDGGYSSTRLLFVVNDQIVTIGLPSVCSDKTCTPISTYSRGDIINISQQISKSVFLIQ